MQSRVNGSHVFRLVPVPWFREIVHSKVAISLAHLSLKPENTAVPRVDAHGYNIEIASWKVQTFEHSTRAFPNRP